MTLAEPSGETLYKEKHSKFFGYAFPVLSEADVKAALEELRKLHPSAGHHCYAWQLGAQRKSHRANDDGEPSGTAGLPIYGQIQSFGLTNVLVVVVRYFGGVKLGAGGLISAYKTSAQMTLEAANLIERTLQTHFVISCTYEQLNKAMRIIRERQVEIVSQKLEMQCELEVAVRMKNATETRAAFEAVFGLQVREK